MKICYMIANHYPGFGGSEKYTLYLAKEARSAGHDVIFVLGAETELATAIKVAGFAYQIIPMTSSFNPLALGQSVARTRELFKKENIEIVHLNMLREHSIAIFCKILGQKIKIVRTFHRLNQFNKKMRPLLWAYNRYTDAFVAPSQYAAQYLNDNGILSSKVTVILNGVPEIAVKKHGKAIGFIGRINNEKGIVELVKEINKEDPPLIIAGGGPELEDLKKETLDKSGITVLGPINDLTGFFESISVLVLPSITEVLPLSVLEAYSAGIPVVAFDIPGTREVINSKTGILVKLGNFKEVWAKATEMLKAKDWENFSQNAQEYYRENFTVTKMWTSTERLYRSLLS